MSNIATLPSNAEFTRWMSLVPIYFARWMWEKAVQHEPKKYSMYLPVYQGQKVIFT